MPERATPRPPTWRSRGDQDDVAAATPLPSCARALHLQLDRRLLPWLQGVAVNASTPAYAGSGAGRDARPLAATRVAYLLPALRVLRRAQHPDLRPLSGRATNDARSTVSVGEYFDGLRAIRSSADSYDRDGDLPFGSHERLLTHSDK